MPPLFDENAYHALWEGFLRQARVDPTPRPTRGRHFKAQVVAIVNDPALFRRLDRIRQAVAGFPGAVAVPDHFLHVPLLDLGPVAPRAARPGEWSGRELTRLADRLRDEVGGLAPFSIDIARVNAGSTEVFAELHPPEALSELNQRLARAAAVDGPYVPRLPLAHFTAAREGLGLIHTLEWFRDRPIGRIRVAALTLIVVHAQRLHPARHRLAELPLGPG